MTPDESLRGVSGIYKIKNLCNNKVYVGRTQCMFVRCRQYISDFKNRNIKHINQYLLNSMDKYGLDNFVFEKIEECPVNVSPERELFWMDYYRSCDRKTGYNLRRDSNGGMETHGLTREKISKRLKKEWKDGVRAKHSEKLKESWKYRDKKKQGEMFSKFLTKWKYLVYTELGIVECLHKDLKNYGLQNVNESFHRTGKDDVVRNGYRVRRVKYED